MADENDSNKLSLTKRILSAVSFLTEGSERVNSDVSNNTLTQSSDDTASQDTLTASDPSKLSIDGKDQVEVDLHKSITQAKTQKEKSLTFGYDRKVDQLVGEVRNIMTSPGRDTLPTEDKPKLDPDKHNP